MIAIQRKLSGTDRNVHKMRSRRQLWHKDFPEIWNHLGIFFNVTFNNELEGIKNETWTHIDSLQNKCIATSRTYNVKLQGKKLRSGSCKNIVIIYYYYNVLQHTPSPFFIEFSVCPLGLLQLSLNRSPSFFSFKSLYTTAMWLWPFWNSFRISYRGISSETL